MVAMLVINETILDFGGNARNTSLKMKPCQDPKIFSQKAEIFLDTRLCCIRLINLSLAWEIEHGLKGLGKKLLQGTF